MARSELLLRRSLACAWRAGPSQLGRRAGLAGSDREFPRFAPPDRARNRHALTSGSTYQRLLSQSARIGVPAASKRSK